MTTWVRRAFDAPGLTQYPTGKHLAAIQDRFGGSAVLCLDVSGSMGGTSLPTAVKGCARFIDEAIEAHYEVAMLLWNSSVVSCTQLSRDRPTVMACLSTAAARGGTNVVPALEAAHNLLRTRTGDRVVAIFGDGDLGDANGAVRKSAVMRSENIRIITCGLGLASAQSLDVISTESPGGGPRVAEADRIEDSIAGMASGLRRHGRT